MDSEEFVPSEIYYTKKNKNDPVETEEGYMDVKLSKYQLVLGVIMRLSSRYTRDEILTLQETTNSPVLLDYNEGYEGRYRSISQIQSLLKAWRKNNVEGISNEEIEKLCHISQAMKDNPSSVRSGEFGFENVNINMSEERFSSLPVVSGCIQRFDKTFHGVSCTIDSGASSSACGVGLLEETGYTVKDLTPCPHIQVNTANAPCTPLGILSTKIYLKWKNQKYFYINCDILVLSSPLKKLLIGIKDLYKANFVLDKNKITLDCYSAGNVFKRRVFQTSSGAIWEKPVSLEPHEGEEKSVFVFESCHHLGMTGGKWDLVVKKKNQKGQKLKELRLPVSDQMKLIMGSKVKINKGEIEDVMFTGKLDIGMDLTQSWENSIFTLEMRKEKGNTEEEIIKDVSQAVEDFQLLLAEKDRGNYKSFEKAEEEMESVKNVDEELLGKMSLVPDSGPEEDDKEYFIPDLTSMTEEWQERFRRLFTKYKDNFSKNKWDIGISNLPEVTLHTKPGEIASVPCRRYLEEELKIVDIYLEELEKKGLIRKLYPDEFSGWNHNVHLVFRQAGSARRFCNALADKGTMEERLALLKQSARAVADVVKLNSLLLPVGQVYLPMVSEILPYLGGKICAQTDLRSGYSTIKMDYESCLKTAFTHRNVRYMHLVMVQGASSSPLLFSTRLELVFNEASFKEFLQQHAPESKLVYSRAIIRYLDDLLLICDDMIELELLWTYLMIQLDKYKIKITKGKTNIVKQKFSFLGWDFIPHKNLYSMESQRRAALAQWEFKADKQYLVSRLCTLNWNSNLIFGFKYLSQLLALLVQTKPMKVKACHYREWQLILFAASWVMHLYIPDLSRNLYLTLDSSFSCMGCFLFQYFPEKMFSTPEGVVWEEDDTGNKPLKNKEGKEVVLSRIECIGLFSKRWGKDDIAKSIVYKECMALMAALLEFDRLIRSCTAKVLCFSDASCLSFLHRLKTTNSRIYSIALIVASYENLSIHFSRGAFLNFVSDIMSRTLEKNQIQLEGAIDPKVLEIIPQQFLSNITIGPETIHKLCLSPLAPEFSALATRRVQPFERILTEDKMVELFKTSRLPEDDILSSIAYGYQYLKKDSVIFQNKKNKNLITQSEFQKLGQKMNFDRIRSHILFLSQHACHVEDFGEMQQLCREFMLNLKSFILGNEELKNIRLVGEIDRLLRLPSFTEVEFYDFMNCFQQSAAYNTEYDYDDTFPCLFIPAFQEEKSEVILEFNQGQLLLRAKFNREIRAGDPVTYGIHIDFMTKYFFTIAQETEGLFYPILEENNISKSIKYLVLGCNQGGEFKVEKNQIIARVVFHFSPNEKCNCISPQRVHFVVEQQNQLNEERNVQILMCELLYLDILNLCMCAFCGEEICMCKPVGIMLSEESSCSPAEHLGETQPGPGDTRVSPGQSGHINYLNQLITLCLSYQRKNIFSPKYVQSLQSSSEFLVKTRELVRQRKTNNYFLYKGCLFFKDGDRNRLCLDDSTTALLFRNLHEKGYHHQKSLLLEHYCKYFKNNKEKLLAELSIKQCSLCSFAAPCRRVNFIQNNRDETLLRPFEALNCDLAENVYQSEDGHAHFIICIDKCTNKVFGQALKTKEGWEVVQFFENLVAFVGIPKSLWSDFGGAFSSNIFKSFLRYYKINHIRQCARSQEGGYAEERVKATRDKLKEIICQDTIYRRSKWNRYFGDALLLINSSAPHRRINQFSRDKLFFGPNRYIQNISFNGECDLPMTDEQHQEALLRLHLFRVKNRQRYPERPNPFILGQLVTKQKSKEELPHDGNGRHLQATSADIYKVIGLNSNSCRLINLLSSDKISVDFGKLRGLELSEIKNVFQNIDFSRESSFDNNLFQRGNNRSCLELVQDIIDESSFRNSNGGEESTDDHDRLDNSGQVTTNQNLGPQIEHPETNQSLSPTNERADCTDTDTGGEPEPDTLRLSDDGKQKLLTSHPYPPHLLRQWEQERQFIERSKDRNTRYPERKRKPSNKITQQSLLTEIKRSPRTVTFNPKILLRDTLTDEEGKYIFNEGKGNFEYSEQWVTDPNPSPKYFENRRGVKLYEDISQREFFLLCVDES